MIAIYKRDLKGFFTGMMGYVLLAFSWRWAACTLR